MSQADIRFTQEKILSRVSRIAKDPLPPCYLILSADDAEKRITDITGINFTEKPREALKRFGEEINKGLGKERESDLVSIFGVNWKTELCELERTVNLCPDDQNVLLNIPLQMYEVWIDGFGDDKWYPGNTSVAP